MMDISTTSMSIQSKITQLLLSLTFKMAFYITLKASAQLLVTLLISRHKYLELVECTKLKAFIKL